MISFDDLYNSENGNIDLKPIYDSLNLLQAEINGLESLTTITLPAGAYYYSASDLSYSIYPYAYNVNGMITNSNDISNKTLLNGPCVVSSITLSTPTIRLNVSDIISMNNSTSTLANRRFTANNFHNNSIYGNIHVDAADVSGNKMSSCAGFIEAVSVNSNSLDMGLYNIECMKFDNNMNSNGFNIIRANNLTSNTFSGGCYTIHANQSLLSNYFDKNQYVDCIVKNSAISNTFHSMTQLNLSCKTINENTFDILKQINLNGYVNNNSFNNCGSINELIGEFNKNSYSNNEYINIDAQSVYQDTYSYFTKINGHPHLIDRASFNSGFSLNLDFSSLNTVSIENVRNITLQGETCKGLIINNAQQCYINNYLKSDSFNTSFINEDYNISLYGINNLTYRGWNACDIYGCQFVSLCGELNSTHTLSAVNLAIFDGMVNATCDGVKTAAFYPDNSSNASLISGTTLSKTIPRCYINNDVKIYP